MGVGEGGGRLGGGSRAEAANPNFPRRKRRIIHRQWPVKNLDRCRAPDVGQAVDLPLVLVDAEDLVLQSFDEWHLCVVRRRDQVVEELAREDVGCFEVALGVAVLAGLRGLHIGNLARPALYDNVPKLADVARHHRVRERFVVLRDLRGGEEGVRTAVCGEVRGERKELPAPGRWRAPRGLASRPRPCRTS